MSTEVVPDLPTFGRYRATAELGAGGMGTVYRAFDDRLRREVAIKTILLARTGQESIERFFHEARAVGALAHPNIIAVFDMDVVGETPYLVLELAPGGSLKQRLERGPLDAATVRSVGIQIALALEAAHARGILHRDVKPANILETEPGTFKLADFGIAKIPDSTLTMTGMFLGSPAYAAPESLGNGAFSPASDVYSLGATLHELLANEPPYGRGAGLASIISKAVEEGPPSLAQRPGVPPDLAAVIRSALATDPKARPAAAAFAHALATGGAELPAVAAPVALATPSGGMPASAVSMTFATPADDAASRRRRRWILVGAALGLLLVGIIAARSGESPHAPGVGATASPAARTSPPPDDVIDDPAGGEPRDDEAAAPPYDEAIEAWNDYRDDREDEERKRHMKRKKKGKKRGRD